MRKGNNSGAGEVGPESDPYCRPARFESLFNPPDFGPHIDPWGGPLARGTDIGPWG